VGRIIRERVELHGNVYRVFNYFSERVEQANGIDQINPFSMIDAFVSHLQSLKWRVELLHLLTDILVDH